LRFEVHILGCGAALPLPGRNPTAQVVNVHEKQFLFDCGEGTQIALRKERIRMMRIDHICISHLHGDHYLGLPGLVSTFNLLGRTRPLHIYGPDRLKEVLDLHQEVGEGRLDFPLQTPHKHTPYLPSILFPSPPQLPPSEPTHPSKNSNFRITPS
jgi:ribonuclease Z